jgi:hypothetical protein
MKRLLTITVLSALVAPLAPLWGQFRMAPRASPPPVRVNVGAGFSAGRVVRGPVAMRYTRAAPTGHRVVTPRGVHSFRQVPSPNFIGTPCLTNPSYSGSFFCRSMFPRHRFFTQPWFMPFYGYPSLSYPEAEETPAPAPATVPDQQDAYLAQQVERLSDEVEQLRVEQASRQQGAQPAAAVQPPAESKPVTTVLVYRDGRRAEVHDYAIMGKTLWVFADETTRRIPLAEFNLDATKKMNDDRGVDFPTTDSP